MSWQDVQSWYQERDDEPDPPDVDALEAEIRRLEAQLEECRLLLLRLAGRGGLGDPLATEAADLLQRQGVTP